MLNQNSEREGTKRTGTVWTSIADRDLRSRPIRKCPHSHHSHARRCQPSRVSRFTSSLRCLLAAPLPARQVHQLCQYSTTCAPVIPAYSGNFAVPRVFQQSVRIFIWHRIPTEFPWNDQISGLAMRFYHVSELGMVRTKTRVCLKVCSIKSW